MFLFHYPSFYPSIYVLSHQFLFQCPPLITIELKIALSNCNLPFSQTQFVDIILFGSSFLSKLLHPLKAYWFLRFEVHQISENHKTLSNLVFPVIFAERSWKRAIGFSRKRVWLSLSWVTIFPNQIHFNGSIQSMRDIFFLNMTKHTWKVIVYQLFFFSFF